MRMGGFQCCLWKLLSRSNQTHVDVSRNARLSRRNTAGSREAAIEKTHTASSGPNVRTVWLLPADTQARPADIDEPRVAPTLSSNEFSHEATDNEDTAEIDRDCSRRGFGAALCGAVAGAARLSGASAQCGAGA